MPDTHIAVLPDGRRVQPGVEISVRGWRGRYRYLGRVGRDGSLVCYGGAAGYASTRNARPEQIRTVHRTTKMRGTQ